MWYGGTAAPRHQNASGSPRSQTKSARSSAIYFYEAAQGPAPRARSGAGLGGCLHRGATRNPGTSMRIHLVVWSVEVIFRAERVAFDEAMAGRAKLNQ